MRSVLGESPDVLVPKGHGLSLLNAPYFLRNLAALAARQPEISRSIDQAALPDGATAATGRDGSRTATYRRRGRTVWLGATSTPRVTAAAQLDQGTLRPGNVSVPGMLSGIEILQILERLEPRYGVFVIEPCVARIRLVLHLHDFAGAIESGRVVLLREGELETDLLDLIRRYPGYEYPRHIWTALQRSSADVEALQTKLERAAVPVERHHADIVRRLVASIRSSCTAGASSAARIAVLGTDDSPQTRDVVSGLVRAAEQDGLEAGSTTPDAPDRCHPAASLTLIHDLRAELVLVVGGGMSASLRHVLPESLPIVTWYQPHSIVEDSGPALGPADLALAGSLAVKDRLHETGVPADRITLCPPGASVPPGEGAPGDRGSNALPRVAMFADLPDDRSSSCGITMLSHARLWEALRAEARLVADSAAVADSSRLLARAQARTGNALSDQAVLDELAALAMHRILPVATFAAAADALSAEPCMLELYGHRVSQFTGERIEGCGPIPAGDRLDATLSRVRYLVLPVADDRAFQWSVDAEAAGTSVLCRTGEAFHAGAAGPESDLLHGIVWFETIQELTAVWGRLLRRPAESSRAAACHSVRSAHTLAHRLRFIRARACTASSSAEAASARV